MTAHGTYEEIADRPALRFERRIAHPIEAVWTAVTEPEELRHWFPAAVAVEGGLRTGARLTFSFEGEAFPPSQGAITDYEPPRLFAFDWDTESIRFELEPDGDGTLLRFTHLMTARDQAARDAAGWHVCLDRMEERLRGADTDAPGTEQTDEHKTLYAEYERRGLPTGAPMPD
jgi:uncharacterized protein YndB with AHSA1/START domain